MAPRRAGNSLEFTLEVAFAYYNIGIQNTEILGTAWNKPNSEKQRKLRNDVQAIFSAQHGIQCLFISEFGLMSKSIDEELGKEQNRGVSQPATKTYFEDVLRSINLSHLNVYAIPPYVALVDPTYWHVIECVACDNLCTKKRTSL